jgi:hypothetical protein
LPRLLARGRKRDRVFPDERMLPSCRAKNRCYARLPGAGYEALHLGLKDLNPEDYPDIHKMSILADVAPQSREYNIYQQKIGKEAQGNTELDRVREDPETGEADPQVRHSHAEPAFYCPG